MVRRAIASWIYEVSKRLTLEKVRLLVRFENMPDQLLKGKVALITGGGRGLGRAIGLGYATEEAQVVVCSRTSSEVWETVSRIRENGGEAIGIAADLSEEAESERVMDEIEAVFGRLDIVFLNAGGNSCGAREPIETVDSKAWIKTIEINLYTAFHVAKASIRLLKQSDNGKILTMGSGMGRKPNGRSSAYSASKAALWMLTQSLSVELAEYGITVNEMIPGPVKSNVPSDELFEPYLIEKGDWQNEWMKGSEDVVPMAIFLASQHEFGPSGQSFALNRRLL